MRSARLLGVVSPVLRELPEMMYEFDRPYVVDFRHYEQRYAAAPTPLDDAIAATLDWYAERVPAPA